MEWINARSTFSQSQRWMYEPLVESAVTSLSNIGWPAFDSRSSWKFVTYRVCYHRVSHLKGLLFSAYLLGPHSVSWRQFLSGSYMQKPRTLESVRGQSPVCAARLATCKWYWLINWIVFYAVSAIFQPYNGGMQMKRT